MFIVLLILVLRVGGVPTQEGPGYATSCITTFVYHPPLFPPPPISLGLFFMTGDAHPYPNSHWESGHCALKKAFFSLGPINSSSVRWIKNAPFNSIWCTLFCRILDEWVRPKVDIFCTYYIQYTKRLLYS